MDLVVLVDENDSEIGVMEKLRAHQEAQLHRAISVVIFNTAGEMLLQQRAAHKYHSPLLWTNACCTHPAPGEPVEEAAIRRLQEEMGLSCSLTYAFNFIYKAELGNGLTEYEFDHVFYGFSNDAPAINEDEVCAYKYISMHDLKTDLNKHPDHYTAWFKLIFDKIKAIQE
ncbi:MAG: isopentenyl-diphosphate Delta-isomerase [Chitinophagaceae bacterium]|jgi:isopentenyl-diphosphate delta-isomerase